MAKFVKDSSIDALLDDIADTCDLISIISDASLPANHGAATVLAEVAVTPGDGNGDFTIADGAVDGRKMTITEQADIVITATGTALHVILSDGTDIYHMTSCTSQALVDNDSNTVTIPAYTHTVRDPT